MRKSKLFFSLLSAAAIGFISTGCGGGSSGTKTIDLTVSVPTEISQKKGKHRKEISVTDVKGILLEDGTEVEGTVDADGNFIVKVPEGSDVHIIATITSENGSEFSFESFVNDATESDQVVDEDSTVIASLVLNESVNNETTIKELLAQELDIIREMDELLEAFNSRDYLNDVMASANSEEDLEAITARIEKAIERLNECNRILALFQERLSQFENSTDIIKIDVLTADDVKDDGSVEADGDIINEFLVREPGIKNIAVGESVSELDIDISLNDDGSISVERGDEIHTTDPVLSKGRISGRFVSSTSEGMTISVKRDGSLLNVDFIFSVESKDLATLAKSFLAGDEVILTYSDVEGKNVVKAIYAEGFLFGTLTALTKTSVTITQSDGTVIELPIKIYEDKMVILPLETEKKFLEETSVDLEEDQVLETTDSEIVELELGEETDLEMSAFSGFEDNVTFDVITDDLKIGDLVIVHWQIFENVKVASGVFPDKPESFGDPILDVDGTRPTSLDDEIKDGDVTDGDITDGDTDIIKEDGDDAVIITKQTK